MESKSDVLKKLSANRSKYRNYDDQVPSEYPLEGEDLLNSTWDKSKKAGKTSANFLDKYSDSFEEGAPLSTKDDQTLKKLDIGKDYLQGEEKEEAKDKEDTSVPSLPYEEAKVRKVEIGAPDPTPVKATQIEYDLEKELKEAERPIDQSEEYGLIDKQYEQSLAQAYDAYQKTKDQQASAALWESIINGIGHLAAGVVGMQTGLDLGGVEFDKTDWQAKASQNLAELREASSQARDVRIMAGDKLEKNYRRSLDQLQQNQKIKDRALEVEITNAKMKTDAERETQRRQERYYDTLLQEAIVNIGLEEKAEKETQRREEKYQDGVYREKTFEEKRKQNFLDNLYRDAEFRLKQEELAQEKQDKEKLALIAKHQELEKRLGKMAVDASKNPELARVFEADLQQYTNLSNQLGIENPAYSSVDIDLDEGWLNDTVDMQKTMVKRTARNKLLQEAPDAIKNTYKYLLKNPNYEGSAKHKAAIEKMYPGVFTGEQ